MIVVYNGVSRGSDDMTSTDETAEAGGLFDGKDMSDDAEMAEGIVIPVGNEVMPVSWPGTNTRNVVVAFGSKGSTIVCGDNWADVTRRQCNVVTSECIRDRRVCCDDNTEKCRRVADCDRYVERLWSQSGVCYDRSNNFDRLADNCWCKVIFDRIFHETLRLW